jgi:hypothetical protein
MIGQEERSWSSLYNVVVPVVLVCVEATWVSAWLAALARLAPHQRADIPFLAIALPAALAATLAGWSARLPVASWPRLIVLVTIGLTLAGLTAGIVGAVFLHGSFGDVSVHPWTVTGHVPSNGAALAWFVAVLACARGSWLGWGELSLDHVTYSVVVAAIAFVAFFIAAALHSHELSFRSEAGPAALLLVLFFPGAIAVVSLANERRLERDRLPRRAARPSMAWLAAVVAPMALVAITAVIIALAIGPLAHVVGRGIEVAAAFLAREVAALAAWLARLLHSGRRSPLTAPHLPSGLGRARRAPVHVPTWLWVGLAAVGAIGVAVAVAFLLLFLRRLRPRLRLPRRPGRDDIEEERSTVFSWGHLLSQVRAMLRRFFDRFRRRAPDTLPERNVGAAAALDEETIRYHYRRFLAAALSTGHGRRSAETALELEGRIASAATPPVDESMLRELTDLYQRARYGLEANSAAVVHVAEHDATELIASLLAVDAGE